MLSFCGCFGSLEFKPKPIVPQPQTAFSVDERCSTESQGCGFDLFIGKMDATRKLLKKKLIALHPDNFQAVKAVRINEASTLENLLNKGLSPNLEDSHHNPIISLAASKGHVDIVKLLLKKGANINSKTSNNELLISWASEDGHTDIVKLLLDRGAAANTKSSDGESIIVLAAKNGHTDIVKLILERGGDASTKSIAGNPIVAMATKKGHTQIVKLMLEHGVDVDTGSDTGVSIITLAIIKKHIDIVKLLLEYQVDVNTKSCGICLLIYAVAGNNTGIVRLLLDFGADPNATDLFGEEVIHMAVKENYVDSVQLLLAYGAQVDIFPSILYDAISVGSIELVRLFMEYKADEARWKSNGEHCVNLIKKAVSRKFYQIAKLLLEYVTDNMQRRALFELLITLKEPTSLSKLQNVMMLGKLDLPDGVEELMAAENDGSWYDAIDRGSSKFVHQGIWLLLAAFSNRISVMNRLLVSPGFNQKEQRDKVIKAFFLVARNNNVDTAIGLLKRIEEMKVDDQAIQLVAEYGNRLAAKLLLNAFGRLNIQEKKAVLSSAIKLGEYEIAKILMATHWELDLSWLFDNIKRNSKLRTYALSQHILKRLLCVDLAAEIMEF